MNYQQAKAEAIELLKPTLIKGDRVTTSVDGGAPTAEQRAAMDKRDTNHLRYRCNIGVSIDSPIGRYTRVEAWGDTWDEAVAMIRRKKRDGQLS